ncbi:MAG: hypothetical protein WA790_02545 [Sulfitobacter sp.]
MNLPAHKATAKLIIAIADPHVEKAMKDRDTDAAMAFQAHRQSLSGSQPHPVLCRVYWSSCRGVLSWSC